MSSEVTAELIEDVFGKHSDSVRFANFCNSVIAESSASAPTIPILSEKPGADGGMDGEWTIPLDGLADFKSPFGSLGWNVFQYKARSVAGAGRQRAFSKLCSDLDGALAKLVARLVQPKECRRYSLFTNLQLGLETTTKTSDGKVLQKQRAQLTNAIGRGGDGKTSVDIFDAAQLAAFVNAHPALRLTYFSGPVARSWNDAWAAEHRVKDYKASVPFVGRSQELSRVTEWLKDATTKVIVLSGPSGMGKTRLALEATRPFAPITTVVEVVDELLRTDFQALGTSKAAHFIIVEDPTREQVEALAKRAVACEGVKLILTVPTDAKAPAPKLTEHEAIKPLPPLQPLNNVDAESLLKAAGATFDRQALDWILLQAGGNPEILLSAAELKGELREKSGDLKRRLHERFCAKIEKELGLDGIRTLKALSPAHYVKFQGEKLELKIVCDSLDLGIHPSRILELLPDLERMGYIRRRGNYVSVIPPLFAARLVEELASAQDHSLQTLFNALGKASQGRFLERMVTVDLPERSAFWDYIFSDNGPLESGGQMAVHFEHIECLARAVPNRTARFLEARLDTEAGEAWREHYCLSTLRELAYQEESCASGMRCLELLALKEIEQTKQLKETKLFCECFVDWYHDFPMSYQERGTWIERLLKSENRTHRLLAAHVVAFVTEPPQSLSGYSGAARRLGQPPPRRMWREIYDYMARLVGMRFELTQSEDKEIAEVARTGLDQGVSQLMGHVSPDQLVAIMEQLIDWNFSGKLTSDVRKMRTAIHWVEERYVEGSQKPDQDEHRDKWNAVLQRMAVLRERFDKGDFVIRLKVATGTTFEFDWEAEGQGRLYGYQKRLRVLASEVTENPQLMTGEAWSAVTDEKSAHTGELIRLIGERDLKKHFLPRFESEVGERAGNWRFGHYCFGLSRADSKFVEDYLNRLCERPGFPKSSLLRPIEFIGPTPANRTRLLQFISDRAVSPAEVTEVVCGHWFDKLPIDEAVTVMDFITQGENWPERVAHVLSLHLHIEKPLPKELIPFGERVLEEIEPTHNNAYECNNIALGIAKTDLERGFILLEKQIATLNKKDWREWRAEWNPLQRQGTHEFWDYLRSQNPEKAYRCFCALKNRHVLLNEIVDYGRAPLLDLENHGSILLKIAKENEEDAELVADSVSIKQPGFFPFAFEFLSGRPIDGRIASRLSSTIVQRFGFGTPLEKEQAALRDVEEQLKKPEIPSHGRTWLEQLKHKIQETIKNSPWGGGDNEHLGW